MICICEHITWMCGAHSPCCAAESENETKRDHEEYLTEEKRIAELKEETKKTEDAAAAEEAKANEANEKIEDDAKKEVSEAKDVSEKAKKEDDEAKATTDEVNKKARLLLVLHKNNTLMFKLMESKICCKYMFI